MSTLYDFTFRYKDGSFYSGSVADDGTFGYSIGETIQTPFGVYSIDSSVGQVSLTAGTISVSTYHDAATGADYVPVLYSEGQAQGGGLGAEYDSIGTSTFGDGGQYKATVNGTIGGPLTLYDFVFTYSNGSSYAGTVFDDGSLGLFNGQSIYTIYGVYTLAAHQGAVDPTLFKSVGAVRTTSYYDSTTGTTYTTGNAKSSGGGHLGTETDTVTPPGGSALLFGDGGQYQALPGGETQFTFTFTYADGSSYTGTVADDGAYGYAVGQTIKTAYGSYAITAAATVPYYRQEIGTVLISSYTDISTGFSGTLYGVHGLAAGVNGLGSEHDFIDDGNGRKAFGGGGAQEARQYADTLFSFRFTYTDGSFYYGTVVDDGRYGYHYGQTITTPYGAYTFYNNTAATQLPVGQVNVTGYIDSADYNTLYTPYDRSLGKPSGSDGLGSEYDFTKGANGYQAFGQGGAFEARQSGMGVTTPVTATNDSYAVSNASPGADFIANVLANDSAPAGGLVALGIVVGGVVQTGFVRTAAGGQADVFPDGRLIYDQPYSLDAQGALIRYDGVDSFTYRVSDANGSTADAIVTLTVGTGVNHPVIAQDDSFVVSHASTAVGFRGNVLANDSAADGGLTALGIVVNDVVQTSTVTTAAGGQATLTAQGNLLYDQPRSQDAQGNVIYYDGTDSFTYRVRDIDGSTADATVTLTVGTGVNHPTIANDDSFAVSNASPGSYFTANVLTNDSAVDGGLVALGIVVDGVVQTGVVRTQAGGQASVTSDGRLLYSQPFSLDAQGNLIRYDGVDSFTYRARDTDGSTADATVTLTVGTGANHPVIAQGDSFAVSNANPAGYFTANVLTNDSAVDGGLVALGIVVGGVVQTGVVRTQAGGQASVSSDGRLLYNQPFSQDAQGNLIRYDGVDSFTYRVRDADGSTADATVTLTVGTGVNHPVIANDDSFAVPNVHVATSFSANVLANDVAPDGGLTALGIVVNGVVQTSSVRTAAGGTATLTPAGQLFYAQPYRADAQGNLIGYDGMDSLVYRVRDADGSTADATVTLTVGVACYCRGTLILTAAGEVPVEDLAIGDVLVTASGEHRPIKWIGRRSYAGRFANAGRTVLPVCFKAGSLDQNIPRRDLWVSRKHAMLLDGVLIPAEHLVNGVSVVQASQVDRVDYFHVELDSHDVIVAEGALSETFIDEGSRGLFHNASEFATLYPAAEPLDALYCAPRVEDGYVLEDVRKRIAAYASLSLSRAADMGRAQPI